MNESNEIFLKGSVFHNPPAKASEQIFLFGSAINNRLADPTKGISQRRAGRHTDPFKQINYGVGVHHDEPAGNLN